MSRSKTSIKVYIGQQAESPLGQVWVAVSDQGLWAVSYRVSKAEFIDEVQRRGPVLLEEDQQKTEGALGEVLDYLQGQRPDFSCPVDWRGMTAFQVDVRRAVMAIPAGETASYGEIAVQVGRPGAARAVGRVNATNPIPLVIPCHRVVGADGSLTGYGGAGGVNTKQWLLDLEREAVTAYSQGWSSGGQSQA